MLIGCEGVDRYTRETLPTINPSRAFCSGSNGMIESEMRVREVRFVFINSLLSSSLAKVGLRVTLIHEVV